MIYLDHCAGAPLYPAAARVLADTACLWGNPGSVHQAGAQARKVLNQSRRTMASLLRVRDREVFFTSGGTESNNWAVKSGCSGSSHMIVGATEHKSVLLAARAMEKAGVALTVLTPDSRGLISPCSVRDAIRPDTGLVSIQAVNNETGVIQDIAEISQVVHKAHALYHCDAVQAFGHLSLPLEQADLISLSAHKFGGPRGTGCLVIRGCTRLAPLLDGGGQELGLRSGTENVAAIASMAEAARLSTETQQAALAHALSHRSAQEDGIRAICPAARVNGDAVRSSPWILNVQFPGFPSEQMTAWLDLAGICVSPGAACSAGDPSPSHVLLAMGLTPVQARESVRFSFGPETTDEEISRTVQALAEILRSRKP